MILPKEIEYFSKLWIAIEYAGKLYCPFFIKMSQKKEDNSSYELWNGSKY